MKLELTIKVSYLPEWGTYEGVRELLQNGRDAMTEHDATFDVRHRRDTDTLVITNEGCTLPHEALLMGHTSKIGRADLIGKFGEGLKLGTLALVRAGHKVKIRSGSEVWIARIARSEKFDADVLVFDIMTGRKSENRVQVEIDKIEADTWNEMRENFLFLHDRTDEIVESHNGRLLLDERYKGKVYVKGIFVQRGDFRVGYDLTDAEVDRDRKMVKSFDLNYRCNSIWRESLKRRPDLINGYLSMIEDQAPDANLDSYDATQLPQEVKDLAVKSFLDRYGSDAVPVNNVAESLDVEHLGRVGIVVNKHLGAVLMTTFGTPEEQKKRLRNETIKFYNWSDLDSYERDALQGAIALLNDSNVTTCKLDEVDIVDFRDEKINGLFKDGRTQIAKKRLSDRSETLRILVHEIAHRMGGNDGEKSHVSNIERIWAGIVTNLRSVIE